MNSASSTILTLLIILIGLPSLLSGQEISRPEYKFKIKLPAAWSQKAVPHEEGGMMKEVVALSAADDATGRSVRVLVIGLPKTWVITDTSVTNEVERGVQGRSVTITGRKNITVSGVPAYVIEGHGLIDSVSANMYVVFMLANGYGYSIAFASPDNVALSTSPDVTAILNSFKFIGKPELHVSPADRPAQNIDLRKYKMRLTLPGGWEQVPAQPGQPAELIFQASDSRHERIINIQVRPKLPDGSLTNEEFIKTMRESLQEKATNIEQGYMTIGGKQALWMRGAMATEGASVRSIVTVANDMTYIITIGLHADSDAYADAALKTVVDSIRFGGK